MYNKLIRYYVSNTGEKLLKVKNDNSDSGAADVSQVEAGEWVMTVCNHLPRYRWIQQELTMILHAEMLTIGLLHMRVRSENSSVKPIKFILKNHLLYKVK